jgi:hypothetical protein
MYPMVWHFLKKKSKELHRLKKTILETLLALGVFCF